MRTIRTKVYKFDELVVDAQQNAIEQYQSQNNEVYLGGFNEDCLRQIEEAGFYDNIKIQYDLGYSQGDGFSFSCDRIETKTLLHIFSEILGEGKEKTAKIIIENCNFECKGNKGRYCFASASDIDYYTNCHCPNVDNVISKVLDKLEVYYLSLCKKLEKQGYSEIEFQNSEEYISDYFISNEIEFTKDGQIFNS